MVYILLLLELNDRYLQLYDVYACLACFQIDISISSIFQFAIVPN
jgi:hypothetical protein